MSALGSRSAGQRGRQGPSPSRDRKPDSEFISPMGRGEHYVGGDAASLSFLNGPNPVLDSNEFAPSGTSSQSSSQLDQPYTAESTRASAHAHLNSSNYPQQSRNQQELSTSVSPRGIQVEDRAESRGYMSDLPRSDYNQYTATGFDLDVFQVDAQFGPMLNLEDKSESDELSNFFTETMQSFPQAHDNGISPFPEAGFLPQAAPVVGSQLLSPSLTTSSSPVSRDDGPGFASTNQPWNATNQYGHKLSRTGSDLLQMHTPVSNQHHSPGFAGSSFGDTGTAGHHINSNFVSPVVRVENYSREESPSNEYVRRSSENHMHTFQKSGTHLSPYTAEDLSDDEQDEWNGAAQSNAPPTIQRHEDGSWRTDEVSGQSGLNPNDRHQIKEIYVPTLEEQEQSRLVAERNAEVADWLDHSDVGSDTGDAEPTRSNTRKKSSNRRRARSTNDIYRPRPTDAGLTPSYEPSFFLGTNIPGPGVYIEEKSDLDEDAESEDEDSVPESPPADIAVGSVSYDHSYFQEISGQEPPPASPGFIKPWNDTPLPKQIEADTADYVYQPPTSNAAIMRFRQRAQDIESASLAATLGSRRMSESDIGSLFAAGGISKPVGASPQKEKTKDKRDRSGSFLGSILPKRSNSNLLKRKNSPASQQVSTTDANTALTRESSKNAMPPMRMGSWGKPKPLRADTNLSIASKDSGLTVAVSGSGQSGPWAQARNVMKRSRSRSDLGKKGGLAALMTQHGGPPMLPLASPANESQNTLPPQTDLGARYETHDNADDDFSSQDPVIMDLNIRSDPIIPTYDGFKAHAKQLNPRLADFMVERVTQEQVRRYKRLQESKVKHLNSIKGNKCSSKNFCTSLGGEPRQLPPRAGNKDVDAPFVGFIVTGPGGPDEAIESANEGTVVVAQFPPGVPLPPVKRLPAEFECPLCFKVKKFYKPSDWTKHVHEDVQPFTCTFSNCSEPKSFKRKADWVRHENERHRQLESWTCNWKDCTHICYRKDNFVQHLVREHKMPEPRVRTARNAGDTSAQSEHTPNWTPGNTGDIWSLVEECRRDTPKQPKEEPCRFCGNICNSWKKLTVHLAKHMEQISMPILALVEQKNLHADSVISPVDFSQASRLQANAMGRPFGFSETNGSQFDSANGHTFGLSPDTSLQQFDPNMPTSGVASQAMHSYPPPQLNYSSNGLSPSDMSGLPATQSYPGLSQPPKARSGHLNIATDPSGANGYHYPTSNGFSPATMPASTYSEQQMYTSPVDAPSFDDPFSGAYLPQQRHPSASMPNRLLENNAGQGMAYEQAESGIADDRFQHLSPYLQQQQAQQRNGYNHF